MRTEKLMMAALCGVASAFAGIEIAPIDTSADRNPSPLKVELKRIGTLRPRSANEIKGSNWTMFFAQYMAPAKVRVNAVAPGFMVNERSRQYLMTPDGGLSPRGEQVMHHTPAGRFGEAQDLLGCVDWLLDDAKSAFVTGITVPVDGGFLASAGV